jgi:hypothetical protein
MRKKWDLAKIQDGFLILTFFRGILSQRQVCVFEINTKLSIFNTLYELFKAKKIHLSKGPFSKFSTQKPKKKIETPQNKEKCLF